MKKNRVVTLSLLKKMKKNKAVTSSPIVATLAWVKRRNLQHRCQLVQKIILQKIRPQKIRQKKGKNRILTRYRIWTDAKEMEEREESSGIKGN